MTETNLPVTLPALADLDLDQLRTAAPALRAALIDGLRADVTDRRAARGVVAAPEDTFDVVRRLTDAGEVLRSFASAFTEAAKEADALTAEEATIALGEQDGVPNGSLFVPDGVGQRIAVRADWGPGDSVWDVGSLIGWLIEDEVADVKASRRREARERAEARQAAADPHGEGIEPPPLDPVALATELAWYESDAREVAHGVALRLLNLGSYTPSASAIKNLRTKLAELGRDAEASIIAGVRSVGPRRYRGVKITREATPNGGTR